MKKISWIIFDGIVTLSFDKDFIDIYCPTRILNDIKETLLHHYIDCEVDQCSISIDGGEHKSTIRILSKSKHNDICRLFDEIGKVVKEDGVKLPSVEIDGEYVKANRVEMMQRCFRLLIDECVDKNINIANYRILLSLRKI